MNVEKNSYISKEIALILLEAYHKKELDSSITLKMLPSLAKAVSPYLDVYVAKYGSPPDHKTFLRIVNNFCQDGPMVQALLNANSLEGGEPWYQLRNNLLNLRQKHQPKISPDDQEQIVDQTLIRIQRYLPNFLFMSRFSTWVYKIWQNETWRLMKKLKKQEEREISLDISDEEGITLADRLPSPGLQVQEATEISQITNAFWERIDSLDTELNVKILRLHLAGYRLEEIKHELGENGPSIATIKRRKDHILERLKKDTKIKQIAAQLGILSDDISDQE